MSPFCARYSVPGSTIFGRVALGLKTVASVGIFDFRDAMSRLTPKPKPAMRASNRTTVSARLIDSRSHRREECVCLGEDQIPVWEQHVLAAHRTGVGVRRRQD